MAVFQVRWSAGDREETLLASEDDTLIVSVHHLIALVAFNITGRVVANMEAVNIQALRVGHVDIGQPFVTFNGSLKVSRIAVSLVKVTGEPLVHGDRCSDV